MKYIKHYENFINDQNRGQDPTFDHSLNPALKEEVKKYVNTILHSNQFKIIFDALDIEVPKDISAEELDSMFDEVEEKAVAFFLKNPERMTTNLGSEEVKKLDITLGDNDNRIPKVTHT